MIVLFAIWSVRAFFLGLYYDQDCIGIGARQYILSPGNVL